MLESYYLLFIHGAVKGSPHNHDYDTLISRALNTSLLGEHVAPHWSLGGALRWTPPISRDTIQAAQGHLPDADLTDALAANPGIVRSVGLYKVMGEAVQAVVGGVYHQFVCFFIWSWLWDVTRLILFVGQCCYTPIIPYAGSTPYTSTQ